MRARDALQADLGVLVDVISNLAGMMLLLACVALLVRARGTFTVSTPSGAKPISYPLAYLPQKRSVPICLKNGYLYTLPEQDLLEALTTEVRGGKPLESLDLDTPAVKARIELSPTATGFKFLYKLVPEQGVPTADSPRLTKALDEVLRQYPADRFFVVMYTWPDDFADFADIREYLLEKGVEVGWTPRGEDGEDRTWDVVYAVGHYEEGYTSIKAQ